jgi:hypothetical protein
VLTRAGSDHTPLLIDSGVQAHPENKCSFSFELSWLKQDGFFYLVASVWTSIPNSNDPLESWQSKSRHLRTFFKGWARNNSSAYKKEKQRLPKLIDKLDIKAETIPLSTSHREEMEVPNEQIDKLRRDEESKWAQCAKVKHVQEGGNNTKYFHLIANGKHRRTNIFQLEQDKVPLSAKRISKII